jgi:hypothetical protein
VLQQRKLHVLEKETRQKKQQLEQLVQDVENDVPGPQKAEPNVDDLQVKDELAVQNVEALAVQNVEEPAEQNVDEALAAQNVEDVDKNLKPFSYFFLIKPLVKYYKNYYSNYYWNEKPGSFFWFSC